MPVAEAAEPAARKIPKDEPPTFAGRPLISGSLAARKKRTATRPTCYRPSPRSAPGEDGSSDQPVCDDLGGFTKSSRAVFPLREVFFDSDDDTWGRPGRSAVARAPIR